MNKTLFFKMLLQGKRNFYYDLAKCLNENGIKVNPRNAEKLHTIACQIFWRIWRESFNVPRAYSFSRQGHTLKEFLNFHKYFWNFPNCITGLSQDLRLEMIEISNEILNKTKISNPEDLDAIKGSVLEELSKRRSPFQNIFKQIEKMRGMNKFKRRYEKQKLKANSVQLILIPLIWESLLRQFKANPQSFITI